MGLAEIVAIVISAFISLFSGVVLFVLKGYMTDMKKYRKERETKERAKDELVLGIARAMLLRNYIECDKKGYYSMEDREVFGKLFEAYKASGGDGIIDQLAPKLRDMATRPKE